jgi:hypothetical protein
MERQAGGRGLDRLEVLMLSALVRAQEQRVRPTPRHQRQRLHQCRLGIQTQQQTRRGGS